MSRRAFLSSAALGLIAPSALAEILEGSSAKAHGQRSPADWHAALRLSGARLARPGSLIQVIFFIDLNCPACAMLWQWFDVPERRRWATYWIPVAYMSKTSTGRAAALLRAADPYAALSENFGPGFDMQARLGGLPDAKSATLAEQSSIRANTRYWSQSLFGTTPLMLYRKKDGSHWQLLGLFPEPRMSDYFREIAPAELDHFVPRS